MSEMTQAEPVAPIVPRPRAAAAQVKPPSRLSTWRPDPRWAHPVEAGLWTYAAGHIPMLGVPPVAMLGVGAAAGLVGATRARRLAVEETSTHADGLRRNLSILSAFAGAAAGLWLLLAGTTSPLSAVGWLLLGTAMFGGAYAVQHTATTRMEAETKAVAEAAEKAETDEQTRSAWERILEQAGLKLRVIERRQTRAGYVLAVGPAEGAKPVNLSALRMAIPDLTAFAAAELAGQEVTVREGDIRVEGTEAAHIHLIHVGTAHVLSETIPFVPIEHPTTITDPIDPALYEDGTPLEIAFGSSASTNGQIVGMTGSGKSVFTNSLIGKLGECVDVLVGVIASDKLVPLVYPWLRPWLAGETERPAIDFVAGQDPKRVMEMLAGVYRIMRERNAGLSTKSAHTPTAQAPAIVLFVEEAGDMPARKATVAIDGRTVGFSELLHLICKADRSAQISVILLDQNALYGSLGDYGSEIGRNTPFRVCLQTLSSSDGPKVLPALSGMRATDTTKLTDYSMLVQPSIEKSRVIPAKSLHLEEDAITPIATRNSSWRPELEPKIAALLGPVWSQRWSAERLPELAEACRQDGLEWPMNRKADDWDEGLRELIESEQQTDVEPTAPQGGMPDVEAAVAGLSAAAAAIAEGVTLPEPLAAVIRLLADPAAPKDFVSTKQLAIMLGRVAGDAPDDEVTEAAQTLGREMSLIDDELRTDQRDRKRGYSVPLLKSVASRLAAGGR